jgi:uncharacterized protein with HEPN domain
MSRRTDDLYLVDLLDASDAIARSLRGIAFDQFVGQPEKRDAILWNLMIIGEAATRLSPDITGVLTEIPWDLIRGFRNRVVHGYFALKWPIVWQIATDEVPRLRERGEAFLAKNHVETYLRWKEITVDGPPEESR